MSERISMSPVQESMRMDLLKNEEIYNIFDTDKFLNRPPLCCCIQYIRSGGYRTLDQYLFQADRREDQVDKNSELVSKCERVGRYGI